jgi:hypothetical protein
MWSRATDLLLCAFAGLAAPLRKPGFRAAGFAP